MHQIALAVWTSKAKYICFQIRINKKRQAGAELSQAQNGFGFLGSVLTYGMDQIFSIWRLCKPALEYWSAEGKPL